MAAQLKLDDSIEDMARRLGNLYAEVNISREPMFSWLHITNDATILGEDLRRDREEEAAERAGKILIRLLEFLGYYLYCHRIGKGDLADLVAKALRKPSYDGHMKTLQEGPSRWILFKFPHSCPKCGHRPCHCMVWPEIFENRREAPEGYLAFTKKVAAARSDLAGKDHQPFTLQTMFNHFESIYHNSYCNQDPWKIGMHLNEEIGEATIELSRMNLWWRAVDAKFDIHGALQKTFAIAENKLNVETQLITDPVARETRAKDIREGLGQLRKKMETEPWEEFGHLVGEKFKEEVSDVFSWLAAILNKLDADRKILIDLLADLSRPGMGGVVQLTCKYCGEPSCNNVCLVTHGISAEITEKVSKF